MTWQTMIYFFYFTLIRQNEQNELCKWLFFHLMIKPSDSLLFITAGKNSQVHYFITKIDALVQPYFIVKYSLLLFFFFF